MRRKKNSKTETVPDAAETAEEEIQTPSPSPFTRQESKKNFRKRLKTHITKHWCFFLLLGIVIGILVPFASFALWSTELQRFAPYLIPHPILKKVAEDFSNTTQELHELLQSFGANFTLREQLLSSFDFRPLTESISSKPLERPGTVLREKNITNYSPLIFLPGFTSTGLEIWEGQPCAKLYFRQRIWGTTRMFQQFMMNQKCWLEHLMLNSTTGLDPEGIKLRAAMGLEAADYVVGGFWVWAKIIENMADIGYDSNSMFMLPFDWRLAPHLMEERDFYFTKLKYMIETASYQGPEEKRKVLLVGHSYGHQVAFYFLKWVESEKGGRGGPDWINTYMEGYINIAGPTLGLPKSLSTLLSGEMKDTAELGILSGVLEYFFAPPLRTALVRSWGSLISMLPVGGNDIWGDMIQAPDDLVARVPFQMRVDEAIDAHESLEKEKHKPESSGQILRFTDGSHSNITLDDVTDFLEEIDDSFKNLNKWFSYEERYEQEKDKQGIYDSPKHWTNPLISSLPNAPKMKIFCLYGIGKPVERAYFYKRNQKNETGIPFSLDTEYTDTNTGAKSGVKYSEGDGTVPLLSLGYMCAKGWRKNKRLNPGGMEVIIREYVHSPVSILSDPRGGPDSADHVDIMGNQNLIRDILYIAAKKYDQVPENVKSEIFELSSRIDPKRY